MSEAGFLAAALGLSAVGQISSGIAQKQAADYNAAVLRQQAEHERLLAEREAQQFARQESAKRASARALLAANGVSEQGTPVLVADVMLGDALLGEETIRRGGQAKANALEADATLVQYRGRAARTASFFQAGESLLTAGGKFADTETGKKLFGIG